MPPDVVRVASMHFVAAVDRRRLRSDRLGRLSQDVVNCDAGCVYDDVGK